MRFRALHLISVMIFYIFKTAFLSAFLVCSEGSLRGGTWLMFTYVLHLYATSGFVGIYDVPHFIKTLKYDVRIITSFPEISTNGKSKKLKAHQVNEKLTSFSCTKTNYSRESMLMKQFLLESDPATSRCTGNLV
jgi:hypothetical protein